MPMNAEGPMMPMPKAPEIGGAVPAPVPDMAQPAPAPAP